MTGPPEVPPAKDWSAVLSFSKPPFARLCDDNDVGHALSFSHYSRLLALPEMNAALDTPALREAVLNLDFDAALPEVPAKKSKLMPRTTSLSRSALTRSRRIRFRNSI